MVLALPLALALTGIAAPAEAQFPGHLHGTVTDAGTGDPVAGAVVTLPGQGRSTSTDPDGSFRLRSLESGTHRVTVTAPGYAEEGASVDVEDGVVARLDAELTPAPLDLEEIRVAGDRALEAGAVRVERRKIRQGGASHLGEVLEGLPGVAVRSTGPGGTQGVSIRGSATDAVLVLVDGVPLNDPVTGEADLSTLPAGQIEEVTVLPGGRSARYGPRAQGGVVLVETRGPSVGMAGQGAVGSLGRRSLEAEAGMGMGGVDVALGGSWREEENSFRFRIPEEAGGGEAVRRNADVRGRTARLGMEGSPRGHRLRATLQVEDLQRGLPGKSFQASRFARQEVERLRASATAVRSGSRGSRRLTASGTVQRVHQRDPDPPAGRPYDVRPRLGHATLRGEADHPTSLGRFDALLEAGLEVGHRRVEGADLDASAPGATTDLALWTSAGLSRSDLPGEPELRAVGRVHRDGLLGDVVFAHDLGLRAGWRRTEFRLAHRSSYSPPTLGDQFFKEGVAVEPNPELRAERIPGEWEVGVSTGGGLGSVGWRAEAATFRADVDGMIIWAPDFRFVWSPRNVDVNRRGAEIRLDLREEDLGLRAGGSYTLARVTYDRGGGGGGQVMYRPRHQGTLDLGWSGPRGIRADLAGRYVGTRYPVPAEANALPAFWTFDLSVGAELEILGRVVEPALRVDRILDRDDAFIFGFPEPGRTWEVMVRVSPGASSPRLGGSREASPGAQDDGR